MSKFSGETSDIFGHMGMNAWLLVTCRARELNVYSYGFTKVYGPWLEPLAGVAGRDGRMRCS